MTSEEEFEGMRRRVALLEQLNAEMMDNTRLQREARNALQELDEEILRSSNSITMLEQTLQHEKERNERLKEKYRATGWPEYRSRVTQLEAKQDEICERLMPKP
ncbi:MAG: hypothetical protein KGL39_37810 [Patescibacteria group bacterium]|nr:hypothetical protein [Patescibacteria group bacterium]